jgi:hypothetical protein
VVVFKDGKLLGRPEVVRDGDALTVYGMRFHKVKTFADGRYEVFRAD